MKELIIVTDGAYSSLRDQGGIGIVFLLEDKIISTYSRMFKHTSNNQMEIVAVIIALKTIIKNNLNYKIVVVSDSQYVIGCASKGWKRESNVKLWEEYDKVKAQLDELGIDFEFKWVHGHTGDKWNELADYLAVEASHEIKE